MTSARAVLGTDPHAGIAQGVQLLVQRAPPAAEVMPMRGSLEPTAILGSRVVLVALDRIRLHLTSVPPPLTVGLSLRRQNHTQDSDPAGSLPAFPRGPR